MVGFGLVALSAALGIFCDLDMAIPSGPLPAFIAPCLDASVCLRFRPVKMSARAAQLVRRDVVLEHGLQQVTGGRVLRGLPVVAGGDAAGSFDRRLGLRQEHARDGEGEFMGL